MNQPDTFSKIGAVCVVVGSIAVFTFRAAHGDLPAADPAAALDFIAARPYYAAIHLGTILGVVLWVGGLIVLSSGLTRQGASMLGRLGVASAVLGGAVFVVDFAVDGWAGSALAARWSSAPPTERADLEHAADIVFTIAGGTSLVSIAILWGLTLVFFGLALTQEGYPVWLGWSGVIVGLVTFVGAVGQYLHRDLIPGVWIYGLLVSLAQLWSLALGVAMWRRERVTAMDKPPLPGAARREPRARSHMA
jgi:hypothetical protein